MGNSLNKLQTDKEDVCLQIAYLIKNLCEKHSICLLGLGLTFDPDFQNGGKRWDGTVYLSLGV